MLKIKIPPAKKYQQDFYVAVTTRPKGSHLKPEANSLSALYMGSPVTIHLLKKNYICT